MSSLQVSDNAKWWGIAGLACLAFTFITLWFTEPENRIEHSLTEQTAADRAGEIIKQLGFTIPENRPNARLIRNRRFLNYFVTREGKPALRRVLQQNTTDDIIFYNWHISYDQTPLSNVEELSEITRRDESGTGRTGSVSIGSDGFLIEVEPDAEPSINLRLSLRGELVSLRAEDIIIPGFSDSLDILSEDSEAQQAFITRQATALLARTIWMDKNPEKINFSRGSADSDGIFQTEVTFDIQDALVPTEVVVQLRSTGEIRSLNFNKTADDSPSITENIHKGIVYGLFPLLVFLFFTIQFLKRLYNRLLDIRLARLDALGFGLLSAAVMSISIVITENVMTLDLYLVLLIIAGSFIGFGLFFFAIGLPAFATAESLNQQAWSDKKHALMLVRHGFFRNRLVGESLLRGLASGCVIAAVFALIYFLNPYAWFISVDSEDVKLSSLMPGPLFLFFSKFLISSIFVGYLYLSAPAAWFRIHGMRPALIIFLLVLLIAPFMHLTPEANNFFITYLMQMLICVVPVLILLRYDLLTTITGLFSYSLIMSSIYSVLTPGISDLLVGLLAIGLFIGLAFLGYIGLKAGNASSELPDLEPDYIKKLVRDQRIEKEFELAREVHDSFLTSSAADIPGFDISASCKTAYEVGGDYFDFIPIDDNHTLIVIADVSGKGVKAAFYMTLLKGYLQSVAEYTGDINKIVTTVNRLFYASTPRGTFITAIAGVLNHDDSTFTFIRAGHDPLYLLDRKTSTSKVFKPRGFALGMAPAGTFEAHVETVTLHLEPGQAMVLFTDGYPESFDLFREQFGEKRLERIARELFEKHQNSSDLLAGIHERVSHFVGSARQHDDMTMVVIQRKDVDPQVDES